MARLHSIRIAGWKSIQNIVPNLELGSINVLIGANGSGKSNFVSFFKLMNELVNERLQIYIGRSGGANSVLHHGLKSTSALEAELADRYGSGTQPILHLTRMPPRMLLFSWTRTG